MNTALDKALDNLREHARVEGEQLFQHELTLLLAIKATLDYHPNPCWIKMIDGRVIYINKQYTAQLDKIPDLYEGRLDIQNWDLHIAEGYAASDEDVIKNRKAGTYMELVTINGQDVPSEIKKWPLFMNGRLVAVAGERVGDWKDDR